MSTARGRQKEQAQRRWRLSAALAGLFFLGLGAATVMAVRHLSDPARLPVRTIRVEGPLHHLDRTELQRALSAAVRGGFLAVDLEKVRQAALRLPWVAGARVRRVWPDRLEVRIEEQQPVARWAAGGLVNAAGQVFRPRGKVDLSLPVHFRGPEEKAGEMLRFYREMAPRFRRLGLEIREVELDRRGEWRMRLKGGVEVVLGKEQRAFRIGRFLEVFPVLAGEDRRIRRVDLRYEQGLAVAWRAEKKG